MIYMAKEKKRVQQKHTRRVVNDVCPFCKDRFVITYKDIESLSKFVSDRGRIISRFRSGVCAKHQRRVGREIKRARHLALVPYKIG